MYRAYLSYSSLIIHTAATHLVYLIIFNRLLCAWPQRTVRDCQLSWIASMLSLRDLKQASWRTVAPVANASDAREVNVVPRK